MWWRGDELGLRLDLCRATTSAAHDTLDFTVVADVAGCGGLVWRSARQEKRLEGGIAREARRIAVKVLVKRFDDVRLVQIRVACRCQRML